MTARSKTAAWLLLAFAGTSPPAAPATTAGPALPGLPGLPTLPEAFGPGEAGTGGVAPGVGLYRIDIDLADYPQALCADFTGAVFYVRRSSLPATTNRWLLYLQGGGFCPSGTDCAERWLHVTEAFGANKLSSDFAPPIGIAAQGIEMLGADNSFAAWNQVFIYYCSSDLWTGRQADFATSATLPVPPFTVPYRINLLGASILDAVIGTLRREHGPVIYVDSAGDPQIVPDLDAATLLVFAGTSAGGFGVAANADRLFTTLTAGVPGCEAGPTADCPLHFAAVVDAAFPPDTSGYDWSASPACGGAPCGHEPHYTAFRTDVLEGFFAGDGESSCDALHPAESWRCADLHHLILHHVGSPLFVRMDLQDGLHVAGLEELGLLDGSGNPLDAADFAEAVQGSLAALPTAPSEEPRSTWLEPRGAFGPQCGNHESLRDTSAYRDVLVPQASPLAANTDTVLANWLSSASPAHSVEPFTGAGILPRCPQNLLFRDGFESGSTSSWSATSPPAPRRR